VLIGSPNWSVPLMGLGFRCLSTAPKPPREMSPAPPSWLAPYQVGRLRLTLLSVTGLVVGTPVGDVAAVMASRRSRIPVSSATNFLSNSAATLSASRPALSRRAHS
jgi:hypothetical protein